jgi:hypothetical protein
MDTVAAMAEMDYANEPNSLALGFDLGFDDLYSHDGLVRLDRAFLDELHVVNPDLHQRLAAARADHTSLDRLESSKLILDLAPCLDGFIGELFHINIELHALEAQHSQDADLFSLKRKFVQRRGASGLTPDTAAAVDGPARGAQLEALFGEPLTEDAYTRHVTRWLNEKTAHADELKIAAEYAGWAAVAPAGRLRHQGDALFKLPQMVDPYRLVETELVQIGGIQAHALPKEKWRHREGFELTDRGADMRGALDQSNYCVKCHTRGRDSCSSGLKDNNGPF